MNIEKVPLVVTLLGVLCSLSAYSLLAYQIMVSPTTMYSMGFKGNATLTKNDVKVTFVPSTVTICGVETADFRITATNTGTTDKELYYEDWTPVVHVYSGDQVVSTLRKFRISGTIGYIHLLKPDESYIIEWRWGMDSFASSPISKGVYGASATNFYVDFPDRTFVLGLETAKVPMVVSLRFPNLLVIGIIFTVSTLVFTYSYRQKRRIHIEKLPK
jgi:hypothetical protein